MTKDEALKMAIEHIEFEGVRNEEGLYVLNACKEALEQPLTRDWKHTIDERIARDSEFKEALQTNALDEMQGITQQEYYQEPVAYRHLYSAGFEYCDVGDQCNECEPLYTHPHQWKGLTANEIASIPLDEHTVQTVEKMVKDKNT